MKLFRGDDLILAGRSIGIQCNTSAISCEKHVHDFIEIEYILSGEAVQTVDNVDYAVKRGDIAKERHESFLAMYEELSKIPEWK